MIKNKKPQAFSLFELSITILIIGLLMGGIIGGKKLVTLSNVIKARTLTNSSPISAMKGLVIWLEASSKKSFLSNEAINNNIISQWNDTNPQSIVKYNFSNSNSGKQPLYIENGLNGLPTIRFDGSDDYLVSTTVSSTAIGLSNQVTIFLAGKVYAGSVFFIYQTGISNRLGVSLSGTNTARFDMNNDSSGKLTGTTLLTNKYSILTAIKNSDTQSIYINGALEATQSNSSSLTVFSNPMYLAINSDGVTFPGKIDISEFIMFNRGLTAAEREEVEQYLSKKWGIKLI